MFSKYLQNECIDFKEMLTICSENHFEENDHIEMRMIIQNLWEAELILIFIFILTWPRIK